MGNLCGRNLSDEEKRQKTKQKKKNKSIDDIQIQAQNKDVQTKQLLLLGAGESGKSTLFKQMITLYGTGYPEKERISYKQIVFQNTISAMQLLIEYCTELSEEINSRIEDKNQEIANRFMDLSIDSNITPQIVRAIKILWADTGIQLTFDHRTKFQFPDSGSYFFSRLDEMCEPDYIPTQQDVLRSRVRTTGIVETKFEIEGNQYKMFDVGGQRNERKKWIHCFENVTCVIFVAAISEYDQTLFEDESTNRVSEALNLFDEICNSRWFTNTAVILFLNKRDLFMDKIAKVPLTVCFDDYTGPTSDYDAGCEFFREKFESRNRQSEKEIYTHVTCATDPNNISHVFNAVKDIILKQTLSDGALL